MQTEPRRRMVCWHQPCSICSLLSINMRLTGDAETYVLPSNGMFVPFAGVDLGRPTSADRATLLPINGGDRLQNTLGVAKVLLQDWRLTLLGWPGQHALMPALGGEHQVDKPFHGLSVRQTLRCRVGGGAANIFSTLVFSWPSNFMPTPRASSASS